ncbi:MAG: NifB/NifX family molybdenum-iron cluster-binding protein [Candidatus Saganbacteria bacterium]|nr:NifB/NifX family molybdenum-iron cluster-binding protein [Candidatus Saganbacteria bacterium]
MKIAISTDNGQVSAHFGRCPEFTVVTIENGTVVDQETVPNPGHQPGFLPKFLRQRGVQMIVAGGMGARAQMLFAEEQIETVVGVTGSVMEAVKGLQAGTLRSGTSLCSPGAGRGYGLNKTECDHPHHEEEK